jgi:hypothetical protein
MPTLVCVLIGSSRQLSFTSIDLAIIVLYFVLVLGLNVYLRKYANTGEEFFMGGREKTALIAGLPDFVCQRKFGLRSSALASSACTPSLGASAKHAF